MQPTRILIKPTSNDLLVRNPFTKRLVAPAGEETLDHTYWRRLAKQGDITIENIISDQGNLKDAKKIEVKK